MAKKKRGEATKRTHARKPVNKELACITHDYGAEGPQFDADGVELVITGWDERERLHHIPHQVVREISRYAIWGYADSRETVATTPILPAVIPGGKLTDDFLIEIGLRKYLYSQPLYRQLVDYNGLGAELAESTLCNGIKALATFLKPIAEAIEAQVLSESVIAIDETTMRQQDDEHGMVIRYLWGWLGGGQVSYHYGGRGAKEILTVLQRHPPPDPSLPRYALTDGYGAYDSPLTAAGFIHAGCWTHIRREFKPLAPFSSMRKKFLTSSISSIASKSRSKKSAQNVRCHRKTPAVTPRQFAMKKPSRFSTTSPPPTRPTPISTNPKRPCAKPSINWATNLKNSGSTPPPVTCPSTTTKSNAGCDYCRWP